ncbi:hypothetical protein BHM03_00040866, partial [Ensete ventricosum]
MPLRSFAATEPARSTSRNRLLRLLIKRDIRGVNGGGARCDEVAVSWTLTHPHLCQQLSVPVGPARIRCRHRRSLNNGPRADRSPLECTHLNNVGRGHPTRIDDGLHLPGVAGTVGPAPIHCCRSTGAGSHA